MTDAVSASWSHFYASINRHAPHSAGASVGEPVPISGAGPRCWNESRTRRTSVVAGRPSALPPATGRGRYEDALEAMLPPG